MSTNARRRLVRDLRKMQMDPPSGVNAAPLENNMMVWQAVIFGPDDTPWEGGTFHLLLEFSEDYPNKPPKVRFACTMFHPNVYGDGQICLDILQNNWSPIYDVAAVLTSIQSLLSDPNPASPANSEAAKLYAEARGEYEKRVKACVEASWLAEPQGAAAAAAAAAAEAAGGSSSAAAAAAGDDGDAAMDDGSVGAAADGAAADGAPR